MQLRILKFCHLAIIALLLTSSISYAETMNVLPDDLPPNLPEKIKGKYRLIEHNVNSTQWVVYDYSKSSRTEEGYKMYPPVYTYDFMAGWKKWMKRTEHAPIDNMYTTELVTIIEAGAKLGKKPGDGIQISGQDAIAKVKLNVAHSSNWQLSSKAFKNAKGKNGFMICGKNTVNPIAVGVWWCSGSKVMSVNGIAKGSTPNLEMAYDVSVGEGLGVCDK